MSPKSLLRHKKAVSKKQEFVNGSTFHRVLWDDAESGNSTIKLQSDSKIKRVVICSGKIYFDLLEERDNRNLSDLYLLRMEQFYPFPAMSFIKELSRFKNAEFVWCQEEPKNQGGWSFIEPNLEWSLNRVKAKYKRAKYVGRSAAASPATGLATQHKKQQSMIINEALSID
jgi:2-oxoglutarate dehydrogenase E1 component